MTDDLDGTMAEGFFKEYAMLRDVLWVSFLRHAAFVLLQFVVALLQNELLLWGVDFNTVFLSQKCKSCSC